MAEVPIPGYGPEVIIAEGDTLTLTSETIETLIMGNRNFSLRIEPGKSVAVMYEGTYKSFAEDAEKMRDLKVCGMRQRLLWALFPSRFPKIRVREVKVG